jgi:hypothetical protein
LKRMSMLSLDPGPVADPGSGPVSCRSRLM